MSEAGEGELGSNYPADPSVEDGNTEAQERAREQQEQGQQEGREGVAATKTEANLDDHTVEELRAIADKEGADLSGQSVKADIIKAIKKHRKG